MALASTAPVEPATARPQGGTSLLERTAMLLLLEV